MELRETSKRMTDEDVRRGRVSIQLTEDNFASVFQRNSKSIK